MPDTFAPPDDRSAMREVDLGRLAGAYRHRPASATSLRRAERAGSRSAAGAWILDIGGGPGNHAAVWAGQGHHAVVLDPSPLMLASVRDLGLLRVRGQAQTLPFQSGRFTLAWFHLSIHYGDWKVAIDEAVRVLDRHGRIEIWTLGSDHHTQSLLARWFPSIAVIDADRFPDPDDLRTYLESRVATVTVSRPHESVVRSAGSWIRAIEAGFVSTLQLLSDEERSRGIEAIRAAYPDPEEETSYELHFTRIVGDRGACDDPEMRP